jgi:hypothetical protein
MEYFMARENMLSVRSRPAAGEHLSSESSLSGMEPRKFYAAVAALFAGGLIVRIFLGIYTQGYTGDQLYFMRWMESAMQYGVSGSYLHSNLQNYPPVFIAILDLYGHILQALGIQISTAHLTSKMLPILFDLGTMLVFFLMFRRWAPQRRLTLLACLAFNPALLADGAVWGQIDVFHSALMIIAVLLVLTQPLAAGALLAIALLSKFQAIVVVPVFGALLLRQLIRRDWQRPALFIVGFIVPTALTAGWFAINGSLNSMIQMAYLSATDMYPQLSLNAFNLWYFIFTDPSLSDGTVVFAGVTYKTFGFALLGAVCLFVAAYILLLRDLKAAHLLKAGALVNLAFFLLPTEIHERYGVPAMLFLLLIPFLLKRGRERIRWGLPAGLFTMSTALNIWLVLNGGFGGKWLWGNGTGSGAGRGSGGQGRGFSGQGGGFGGQGGGFGAGSGSGAARGSGGQGGGAGGQGGGVGGKQSPGGLGSQGKAGNSAGGQNLQGDLGSPSRSGASPGGSSDGSLYGWEHYFAVGLAYVNIAILAWILYAMIRDLARLSIRKAS